MSACAVLLFYRNHFCLCVLAYVYYYSCNSTLLATGHGNSSKNSVHAAITERPGVQGLAFKATSSRETRQLIVNHLYFICNLTLLYALSTKQSLRQDVSSSSGESSGSSGT